MKILLDFALCYIGIINLVGFAIMGIDKSKAKRNAWRIPEATLFLVALLGGGIGSTLGMHLFHHKTKHWYFRLGLPAIAILEYTAVIYLFLTFTS